MKMECVNCHAKLSGNDLNKEINRYVCPSCGMEMPRKLLENKYRVLPVVMLGSPSAGKSMYIGALLSQIKTRRRDTGSVRYWDAYELLDDKAEELEKYYAGSFFDDAGENKIRNVMSASNVGDYKSHPLFLHFTWKKWYGKKEIVLWLVDVAGEGLKNGEKILENYPVLSDAKGLIVLLEPMQMPKIKQIMQERKKAGLLIPLGLTETVADASTVCDFLQAIWNRCKDKATSIPFVLSISKIDTLRGLKKDNGEDLINEDLCFLENSRRENPKHPSLRDWEAMNEQMDSLLGDEQAFKSSLELQAEKFPYRIYMGCSAIGRANLSQDKDTKEERLVGDIVPYHVKDPLLYILYQHGYIEGY